MRPYPTAESLCRTQALTASLPSTARPSVRPFHPEQIIRHRLESLHAHSPRLRVGDGERMVILSDLHVGNGGASDDFTRNGPLVHEVLEEFYLRGGYRLVLNGDVEELQNFALPEILKAWPGFFELLGAFEEQGRLVKILGNHDEPLERLRRKYPLKGELHDGMRFTLSGGREFFVFHGHQASNFHSFAGRPAGYLMRTVALPLGFRNITRTHKRPVRIRLEKRVYDLARRLGVAGVIGHTHRPLFESLSKADYLKIQIENLCREYAAASMSGRARLERGLKNHYAELRVALSARASEGSIASVYDPDIVVPCLFNSGCAIGKRGITAIEVGEGEVRLVHWFDEAHGAEHTGHYESEPEALAGTGAMRVVLRSECLEYIFARIRLLADGSLQD